MRKSHSGLDLNQISPSSRYSQENSGNLTVNLELDVDYREVSRDDPELVAIFDSTHGSNQIPVSNMANRKKYYLISGEGLKMDMAAKTEQGKR